MHNKLGKAKLSTSRVFALHYGEWMEKGSKYLACFASI